MTEIENASREATSIGTLSLDPKYPLRPAYGTAGKEITLWANYVQLAVNPKLVLYSYSIKVEPEAVGKKLVRLVGLLLEESPLSELQNHVVTDFKGTLVSRQRLDQNEIVFTIQYRDEGEDEPKQRATKYKVTLSYTYTLAVNDLIAYLTSTNLSSTYSERLHMIQALNIFLNHYSKTNPRLTTIGASRDFPLARGGPGIADLGSGLQAIRGFFASVRVATARILVNVNVTYGAFYKAESLTTLMSEYGNQNRYKLMAFIKRSQ